MACWAGKGRAWTLLARGVLQLQHRMWTLKGFMCVPPVPGPPVAQRSSFTA